MLIRIFVVLLGIAGLLAPLPTLAQGAYDSSLKPFATRRDPRPDPTKVPRFTNDTPTANGDYMRNWGIGPHVVDWLQWLKADWPLLRNERIGLGEALNDLRATIPEEGGKLLKVVEATPREALLKFNSKHNGMPHDALYAFSQARRKITDAELEVSRAQSSIVSANASAEAALARHQVHQSGVELEQIRARRAEIMKNAETGWAKALVGVARTAIGALKDPASAMKTIGVDFIAESVDFLLTQRALAEHQEELIAIGVREENLGKIISDGKLKDVEETLKAAQATLQKERVALIQAEIRRLVALADARHQLLRLAVLEEGDGAGAPSLFRALAKYHSVTDVMAGYVETSGKEYLFRLSTGPSASAGRLYDWLNKDITQVGSWTGDFQTWLTVAKDTRTYLGAHYAWYNSQTKEILGLMNALGSRAHWKLSEGVVSHTLLVMEQGGKL